MRRVLFLVVLLVVMAAAPGAHAASTIGQVFTPTAETTATIAQTGVASGVGYTVPNDGVITSWSFQADTDGATMRLKVARLNEDGTYSIIGQSDYQTAASNQLQTFQTQIAVRAGDVIGTTASAGKTVAYTGGNDDQVVLSPGDQETGTSGTYSNVQGIRVDVSASIEGDADADGFGDESQDLCTNDPGIQSPCAADLELTAASSRPVLHPGEEGSFVLTLTNHGPSRAFGVRLTIQLSDELFLLGNEGGDCGGKDNVVTCTLGDVPSDGAVTVRLNTRAKEVGTGSVVATVAATTVDPNVSKNSAGASTSIQWRPGRCANVFDVTAGNDFKKGTKAGDMIDGLLGNDVLDGLGGPDCLTGGDGNDRLVGDDGNDRLDGGPGNDRLDGGTGSDQIDGGSGADRIVGGASPDRIGGGSGNDTINAVDRRRDHVNCGSGRKDLVRADRGDILSHCEKVVYAKTAKKKRSSKR
jgi:Ca2+-binding RTX toxin-like protein